jgi:hypothetical protein
VSQVGNCVRAAILRAQADRLGQPEGSPEPRAELEPLVPRLQAALHLDDREAAAWRETLPALLPGAARGTWPAEARLLFDLQNVCLDHERPVYSPDMVEWAYSGFRAPFLRPLPNQSFVLTVKHLRAAIGRLPSLQLTPEERQRLARLLHDALHKAETRLRDCFRPLIIDVLAQVGLRPSQVVEDVARSKLVEELLDRISERGLLTMSDLRDAVSRNRLKMPDLTTASEFFRGDCLILANRRLATTLAGVYRRGEVYLRWLQRISSAAFGTPPGRLFTRYVAIPFGAAFLLLKGLEEVLEPVFQILRGRTPVAPPIVPSEEDWNLEEPPPAEPVAGASPHAGAAHLHLLNWYSFLGVGLFILALLHVPPFRRVVFQGLVILWRAGRAAFYELPSAFLKLPLVRRVVESWPALIFFRYFLKPALLTAAIWEACWLLRPLRLGTRPEATGLIFVAVSLLLNTRLGRNLEELITDWGIRSWQRLQLDIVPGLLRFIMSLFKGMVDAIESVLYGVDEWLRFRQGQSRLTLVAKTVLGLIWFVVSYLIRIFINLFAEPTFNPIKHFPVVTVAAKVMLPFTLVLGPAMTRALEPFVGTLLGGAIAFLSLFFLPGLAGFAVWEFKENWRLYRANQSRRLQPVVIGHHGETMGGFLKPGFYSGTLPRLYTKLRRAERRALHNRKGRAPDRYRQALGHVEESLHHFIEREFLNLVNANQGWKAGLVSLSKLDLDSNRVKMELACPAVAATTMAWSIEEHGGWLLARVARAGWLAKLPTDQRLIWSNAMAGLYKLSGIELVHEQIRGCFPQEPLSYDLAGEGLILWPKDGLDTEVLYELPNGPVLRPRGPAAVATGAMPEIPRPELLLQDRAIDWQAWCDYWEMIQAGPAPDVRLLGDYHVLPAGLTVPASRGA